MITIPNTQRVCLVFEDDNGSKVYRSSQPNYIDEPGIDTVQVYSDVQIEALLTHNIKNIISANYENVSTDSIQRLNCKGIEVHHYRVKDFTSPTREQVTLAAKEIQKARSKGVSSLIYCGYGCGRTGTFVSAWEILAGIKTKKKALEDTTAEDIVPAQKILLESLTEGELVVK